MKKMIFACAAAVLGVWLAGCADPVVVAEVLQLKQGDKVYTKYNIWYENPAEINCLNIQRGGFIPLGTEIEPVRTESGRERIIFRDRAGREYAVNFSSGHRLCTMADYIGYTFGTQNRDELLKGVSGKARQRILRGEVVPGMTAQEVLLAYGPPPAVRTPDMRNDSWIYFITDSAAVRVIFRGGVVRNVLKLDEQL